jgi:hypothetical protein
MLQYAQFTQKAAAVPQTGKEVSNQVDKNSPVTPITATIAIVVLLLIIGGGWYLFLRPNPGEANKPDVSGMSSKEQEDARVKAGGMPRIPGQPVPADSTATGGGGTR